MRLKFRVFRDLALFVKVYSQNSYLRKYNIHTCSIIFALHCSTVKVFGFNHGNAKVLLVKSKSLPDPNGPLSSAVKPQAIKSAEPKGVCPPRIQMQIET